MRVVEKLESVFREGLAGAIEDCGGFATRLFVEGIIMRNPRAAGVLQAKRFRVARNALGVVAIALEWEMAADRLQSFGIELFFEFFRREIVGAGQFDVLDAKTADPVE